MSFCFLVLSSSLILDRGFFSYENLSLLKDDSYIIAASLVSRVIKNVFSSASLEARRIAEELNLMSVA